MALAISSRKRFSVSGSGFIFGRRRKELLPETISLSSAPLRNISWKTRHLRQMVVQLRIVGIFRDGLLEIRDGLGILEIIEMVESLRDQWRFGSSRNGGSRNVERKPTARRRRH